MNFIQVQKPPVPKVSSLKDPLIINFASGQPPENLLPFKLVAEAASNLLREYTESETCSHVISPLSYGDNTEFFCQRLASFLEVECGRRGVNPDLIVPTGGVSSGLDLLCTMLCKNLPQSKRGVVFVEDATYYLSAGIFEDHNLYICTLPMDGEGVIIEEFRNILHTMSAEGSELIPLFFYTIPTFHNPTGRTMPLQRRHEVLSLTQEYNVFVVADEVYQMLGFTEYLDAEKHNRIEEHFAHDYYPSLVTIPLNRLQDTPPQDTSPQDTPPQDTVKIPPSAEVFDHVISVSSFSKILAPGLRVGWVEFASMELANRFKSLGVLRSGSSISHFASCVAVSCMLDVDSQNVDGSGISEGTSEAAVVKSESICVTDSEEGYTSCQLRQHIRHLRETLATKYEVLTSSLMEYSQNFLGEAHGTDMGVSNHTNRA